MKKLTLLSLASLMSAASFAEGYQVNLLSAKQAGMGHVGTAMKLGAESMHFNPAGMAFMEGTADFSVGASGVFAKATYENTAKDYKHHSDNDVSTPMYMYAGFRVYDNLKAGIALTTPYGSGMNWGDNWRGANLVQSISLKAFSLQPTIAWKVLDNFSVGAGAMIAYGNVDLSKALLMSNAYPQLGVSPDVALASVRLKGKSKVRAGFNVGVLWDVNDQWSLGASYRSKIKMKVTSGEASLRYSSEKIQQLIENLPVIGAALPKLDQGTFSSELPLPANLTVGASYRPISGLEIAMNVQMVGWKAYDFLNVNFNEADIQMFNQNLEKNYKSSMAVRLGAQYALTPRFDVRAGIYYDQTPVDTDLYNPETPGMDKIGTSIGFSFKPFKGFSIDFAALYVAGLGNDGTYPMKNLLTGKEEPPFEGHYTTSAFSPTLGLSYSF
ncbi:MAG: outer membrane protein transport protein [Bacteroidales bacterium]